MLDNDDVICKKVARLFAEKDWHKLNAQEQEIVADLAQAGYLSKKRIVDGFVGKCA